MFLYLTFGQGQNNRTVFCNSKKKVSLRCTRLGNSARWCKMFPSYLGKNVLAVVIRKMDARHGTWPNLRPRFPKLGQNIWIVIWREAEFSNRRKCD